MTICNHLFGISITPLDMKFFVAAFTFVWEKCFQLFTTLDVKKKKDFSYTKNKGSLVVLNL